MTGRTQILDALKQLWQARLQSLGDLFKVHKGDVPHPALYATVVCPVQPAPLRSLFLIDPQFLADATDGAAKPDANIERH